MRDAYRRPHTHANMGLDAQASYWIVKMIWFSAPAALK